MPLKKLQITTNWQIKFSSTPMDKFIFVLWSIILVPRPTTMPRLSNRRVGPLAQTDKFYGFSDKNKMRKSLLDRRAPRDGNETKVYDSYIWIYNVYT